MKLVKMVPWVAVIVVACGGPAGPPAATPASSPSESTSEASVATPRKPRDVVQPVRIEKQERPVPIDPNGIEGDPNGIEGGVVGGDLDGAVAAPPPPPPPPPPNVSPRVLDAARIAGDKNILPDDVTREAIVASGKTKLIGSYKVCVTVDGAVARVMMLKSTGFPGYDEKIQTTIRNEWRYRPIMVNGKPSAVCTAVTFIYSWNPDPDPPPPPPPPPKQH